MIKLFTCSSLSCTSLNCNYCKKCSHAIYHGHGVDVAGNDWSWFFSPQFGVTFIDEKKEELKDQPDPENSAWKVFHTWHNKFRRSIKD